MSPDYFSPDNVLVVTFGEDPENDKNAYQALTDLKQLDSQIGGPLGVLLGGTTGVLVGSLFDLDHLGGFARFDAAVEVARARRRRLRWQAYGADVKLAQPLGEPEVFGVVDGQAMIDALAGKRLSQSRAQLIDAGPARRWARGPGRPPRGEPGADQRPVPLAHADQPDPRARRAFAPVGAVLGPAPRLR